ncbi:hypothetical protein BDV95DRAFT_371367 [Massariosphaeria phaeospora]|uniref:Uncharacterized protein n=1 Tax=Massariosphaeria phaeospora TaxID=100035 RepID=A0A7C8IBN0_9PLEO|nr:hypothetical protein BDV95DRAFT_371367 [Massariosphaeria phaeospora]
MDPRQPQHPFTRPTERPLIHNPNHQPSPQTSQASQATQAQPFAGYPPASQPQLPIHVPFSADPYPASRRDPFLHSAAQHARRSSYGVQTKGASQAQGERHGGWANTGTMRLRLRLSFSGTLCCGVTRGAISAVDAAVS